MYEDGIHKFIDTVFSLKLETFEAAYFVSSSVLSGLLLSFIFRSTVNYVLIFLSTKRIVLLGEITAANRAREAVSTNICCNIIQRAVESRCDTSNKVNLTLSNDHT
jgi:hypothetical protein